MKFNTISFYKTILFVCFFSFLGFNLNAQTIGVSSGVGVISYFDFEDDPENSYTEYKSGSHQFVKLDLINYLPNASFLKLSFNLERSSGTVRTSEHNRSFCGVGFNPNNNLNSEVTIYRMGLRLMPLNMKVYKGLRFSAGTELSRIFRSRENKLNEVVVRRIDLEDRTRLLLNENGHFQEIGVGLILEFQFGQYNMGNGFYASPIYNANVSISEELKSIHSIRSIRQAIGVAITWDLKSRVDL